MTVLRKPLSERVAGGLGAAVVVTGLCYMLLVGLAVGVPRHEERDETLLDLTAPPPPRETVRPPPEPNPRKAAVAAPRNLTSKPTEIVAPRPPILLAPPPPVIVAPVAGAGALATSGASSLPGPGQGAGGEGNGTGAGERGDGDGAGDLPPRLIRGRLRFSDLTPALRATGVSGTVAVRYHVDVDGRVRDCRVTVSSGNAGLDAETCRLLEERFRYDPSRRPGGQPVRSTIEENHSWIVDRTGYERSD